MSRMLRFDHLAVAAPSLADGAAMVEAALGVAPPPGGAHPLMATHNLLTAAGPDTFLEVIAPDPEAAPPKRARWFGLDSLTAPRLALVLAVDDLDAAIAAAAGAGVDIGRAETLTRGDLRWRFAVRDDGAIPLDGAAPLLIEWPAGPHPAGRMRDLGLRFTRIVVESPDLPRLLALYAALGGPPPPIALAEGDATAVRCEMTDAAGRGVALSVD